MSQGARPWRAALAARSEREAAGGGAPSGADRTRVYFQTRAGIRALPSATRDATRTLQCNARSFGGCRVGAVMRAALAGSGFGPRATSGPSAARERRGLEGGPAGLRDDGARALCRGPQVALCVFVEDDCRRHPGVGLREITTVARQVGSRVAWLGYSVRRGEPKVGTHLVSCCRSALWRAHRVRVPPEPLAAQAGTERRRRHWTGPLRWRTVS